MLVACKQVCHTGLCKARCAIHLLSSPVLETMSIAGIIQYVLTITVSEDIKVPRPNFSLDLRTIKKLTGVTY